MNRKILAGALGRGVEAAAQLRYADAKKMLANNDAMVGDVFSDSEGCITSTAPTNLGAGFARWRIEAIQEIIDEKGPCVELFVLSSDGEYELNLHYYVRDASQRCT